MHLSGNLEIFSKVVDATQLENIGGVVVMWSEPDRIDFEVHGAKDLNGYNKVTDNFFTGVLDDLLVIKDKHICTRTAL